MSDSTKPLISVNALDEQKGEQRGKRENFSSHSRVPADVELYTETNASMSLTPPDRYSVSLFIFILLGGELLTSDWLCAPR